METSKALERQICRVYELLERSPSKVTWDDRVRDPDNPKQFRQIDITIRRQGRLTIVECRLSKRRQDVKWIEELIGRRKSLGAHAIVAVSSSGFTSGARKKAKRYGVRLRDLRRLTEDEIRGWDPQVALTLYYYRYSDLNLTVGLAGESEARLDSGGLGGGLVSHPIVQSAFNAAAKYLDSAKLLTRRLDQDVLFGVRIRPRKAFLCGKPVLEVGLEGKARLVAQRLDSPTTFRFGDPAEPVAERQVTVQRFVPAETNIVHDQDRVAIDVDLSRLTLPPLSQIRYIRTESTAALSHQSFAITDPGKLQVAGRLIARVFTNPPGRIGRRRRARPPRSA